MGHYGAQEARRELVGLYKGPSQSRKGGPLDGRKVEKFDFFKTTPNVTKRHQMVENAPKRCV